MNTLQIIKASLFCDDVDKRLSLHEESLTEIDDQRENGGRLSPSAEANDIKEGNKKILLYIDSLRGKQRCVTPDQISKDLGYSKNFIESILMANGFQED